MTMSVLTKFHLLTLMVVASPPEELINVLVNEDKLPIKSFVSDCHSGIAKMIREQYPDIKHSYDIWHTTKRLRKKLDKAGKKHPKIVLWTGDLINHFWWSCQACMGDPDLLLEIYHSCLYHVLNIHSWGNRYRAPILKTFRDMRGTKPYPVFLFTLLVSIFSDIYFSILLK